jgi:hypothetical protein
MPFADYLFYLRADLHYACYPILEKSGIIGPMERKAKITVYLPQRLYIEIHERHLERHFSHLVSLLLEEFLRATDVRIYWAEMPNKAEQREYIERKVRELFSRAGVSSEPPKQPVQEKTEPTYVQERPKDVFESAKPKPPKEEPLTPPKEEDSGDDIDILKSLDNLW